MNDPILKILSINTSPSPNNVVATMEAVDDSLAAQHDHNVLNNLDSVLSFWGIDASPAPDNVVFNHLSVVDDKVAAPRLLKKNMHDFTFSSQRPQKSTVYIQEAGGPDDAKSEEDMGINIIAASLIDITSFYSANVLADIPGSEVSFSLPAAKQVLIMGTARYLHHGDEVVNSAQSKFGFSVDGVDYPGVEVNWDIYGSTAGYGFVPCTFFRILTLAAGAHTIKLRGMTQNGESAIGVIVVPIQLTVLG